jgi:hypothetical protein
MAIQTAATIKTQAAAIATALNVIFDDTGATGNMEATWKDARSPLRDIKNLVTLDNVGQFAANDDFVDAAYGGAYPQQYINDHYKMIP